MRLIQYRIRMITDFNLFRTDISFVSYTMFYYLPRLCRFLVDFDSHTEHTLCTVHTKQHSWSHLPHMKAGRRRQHRAQCKYLPDFGQSKLSTRPPRSTMSGRVLHKLSCCSTERLSQTPTLVEHTRTNTCTITCEP